MMPEGTVTALNHNLLKLRMSSSLFMPQTSLVHSTEAGGRRIIMEAEASLETSVCNSKTAVQMLLYE